MRFLDKKYHQERPRDWSADFLIFTLVKGVIIVNEGLVYSLYFELKLALPNTYRIPNLISNYHISL